MNIDMHSHFIPEKFIKEIKKANSPFQADLVTKGGKPFIQHEQGYIYPYLDSFYDEGVKLREMNEKEIGVTVLSTAPPLFYYWADKDVAHYAAQLVNDEVASFVKKNPTRFRAMATVPMNDVELACQELDRVVREYGIKAVEIGSHIEGKLLTDKEYYPFFKKAEELGVMVFIHPYYIGSKNNLEKYYLTNLIGNPLDTSVTIAHMIFSGFTQRFPFLNVCFAHGGGYIPYQIGRLEHGYKVREEPKADGLKQSPTEVLKKFYFDSITFNKQSLEFLVDLVGSEKVLMGSDYPFDMGDPQPVQTIHSLGIEVSDKNKILSQNVQDLLDIKTRPMTPGK
ncbi:amidohydrolase family protein [Aquibacillus sediminis]|uniref:amidohydrolase family protein n=1 Tax=Aquibacillus sediminis TaxID=2574734 RepID=UPI001108100D|nr:amidohydrolase family protein [Aquibacillus sediminis]